MKQNLKERVKGKNGITLIALVITIIVLLILAGVTIATLTGDNGILTKAQSAKKVSTDAEIEEKIKLAVIASKINESNTVDTDVLTTELNNQFGDDGWEKTEIDENTWKVTVNGKSYKIDLTTGAIEKVTIVEVLGVGSYVNYSVDYDNVGTTSRGRYIPKDEYAGKWRILDLGAHNSDGTYGTDENPVRIVSAGVPLSYYHYNNSSTSVTNLTTGFFSTPINTETDYNYYKCGFKNGSTALTNINDVKNLFNNNLTAKNGETPKVQAMTKEDLDKVYDPTGETTTTANTYVNDAKFDNMLAIPCKDQSSHYVYYLLASADNGNGLWIVGNSGRVYGNYYNTYGVRPVVSLVSNISITKGTNGAWNLSSNNNQN